MVCLLAHHSEPSSGDRQHMLLQLVLVLAADLNDVDRLSEK